MQLMSELIVGGGLSKERQIVKSRHRTRQGGMTDSVLGVPATPGLERGQDVATDSHQTTIQSPKRLASQRLRGHGLKPIDCL